MGSRHLRTTSWHEVRLLQVCGIRVVGEGISGTRLHAARGKPGPREAVTVT